MEAALNFSLTFLSREKEGKRKIVLVRFRRWRIKSAMRVKGREDCVVRFPSGMELLLSGSTRRPEPLHARNCYLPPLVTLRTPPFPKGI